MNRFGTIEIEPHGRLMIGGYAPRSPDLDDGTARRPFPAAGVDEERPFIPGSAIKGALRETYTRLLLGAGQGEGICDDCRDPAGVEQTAASAASREACPVCRLFGAPAAAGTPALPRLCVDDAALVSLPGADEYYEGRHLTAVHHVSVDRRSRTRAGARLYGVECLAPFGELRFKAMVEATDLDDADWERLKRVAEAVLAIGAGRSTGQGRVTMRLDDDPGPGAAIEPTATGERGDYLIALEPHDPLCLGNEQRFGNFTRTRRRIPGSVVRGAVGHTLLRAGLGEASELFASSFKGADACRFSDLLPSRQDTASPRPVPETALCCKAAGEAHGVHDSLLLQLLALAVGGADLPWIFKCPRCGDRLARPDHPTLAGAGGGARLHRPSTVAVTRVALSRSRGRAASGLLYTLEELRPDGVRFIGRVHGLDRRLADWLRQRGHVHVGKGVARGLGKCRVTLAKAQAEPMRARIDRLHDAWHKLVAKLPGGNTLGWCVPLLVTSPWPLEPDTSVDELLQAALGPQVTVHLARVRTARIGRYVTEVEQGQPARGGVTALRTAVRPGGVVVLGVPSDQVPELLDRLEAAERSGLLPWAGPDDRACGLGGVTVADPLHVENSLHLQSSEVNA